MQYKYSHLLSPVKVGDLVLKNRIINAKCIPEGLQAQDPVPFPNEQTINFAANLAKAGASTVTCAPGMFNVFKGRTFFTTPFDMEDRNVQACFRRMISRIHNFGAAANAATMCNIPNDFSISELRDMSIVPRHYNPGPECPFDSEGRVAPEISKAQIREFIKQFTECCVRLKSFGFDMINIYASYDASILAKSLSPLFNQRIDEYGGSLENRARLLVELLSSIKEACGWGFPIELQLSGREGYEGGYTTDDFVRYCKLFDGLADIIQIRAWDGDHTHASSYNCRREYPTNLVFAEALKQAKLSTLVAPVGGFQDPELMDNFIAEGRTDLIALARALICDPDYGKKLYTGKGEEITACIRCDRCHAGVCSVNPQIGSGIDLSGKYSAPEHSKKVAVIGGGPSGLKAAAVAAERGHRVTLFEKNDYLGGQLHHADFMYDKWSLRDFKNSLIAQAKAAGVEIRLGITATAGQIEDEGFEAIIAACGSVPKTAPIPGADGENIWAPIDTFGREKELGENVVVVGGAMVAVDTALYLAHNGHKVTIITRSREAAYDNGSHSSFQFKEALYAEENINIIENAHVTAITGNQVEFDVTTGLPLPPPPPDTYMSEEEKRLRAVRQEIKVEHRVLCFDSLVFSAGRRPLTDECLRFSGLTPEFYIVGDANMLSGYIRQQFGPVTVSTQRNTANQDVLHCISTAWSAANMI